MIPGLCGLVNRGEFNLYGDRWWQEGCDGIGIPYTRWGIGGTDQEKYPRALDAGRVEQDIPVNHSEFFAPVIEPTLPNGTQALVVAALTYLAK